VVRFSKIVKMLMDLRGVGWADVGEGTRGVLPFVALSREEESLFDAHLLGFGFRLGVGADGLMRVRRFVAVGFERRRRNGVGVQRERGRGVSVGKSGRRGHGWWRHG
jgi:hypothetical protein